MTLVANWRRVLRHAWSVHLSAAAVVAAILTGLDAAWPLMGGALPISAPVFAAVTGLLAAGALLSRFVYQESTHDD